MRTSTHLLLLLVFCAPLAAGAQADSTAFDDLLFQALQGDMRSALKGLDTLDDAALRPDQVRKKHTLLRRFGTQDEQYDFPAKNPELILLTRIYHRYWTDALLDGEAIARHDSALASDVSSYLLKHDTKVKGKKINWVRENWNTLLEDFLKGRLKVFPAIGRTGMYYDLLLHARETEVRYPIAVPEDTLEVKVIFMDSVLSNGWEGFATVETYFPGGWATTEALYCVRGSYDLASEQFAVSYIKHEGKHFADYKRFPKLQGPDLEYRAKLVELGAATTTLYDLVRFFMQNSAYDANNPHAYANFCVIRDLSRALFKNEREEDMEVWKRVPIDTIQHASTELLLKNTRDLQKAGASKVERFIE